MKKPLIQNPTDKRFNEWVFYDGQCKICINLAHRFISILNRRGIGLTPLQTGWVMERIPFIDDPLKEMLFQTSDGRILGGADAVIYLSRKIWWAYGLFAVTKIPGMKNLLRRVYGVIARNRYCISGSCKI